MGLPSGDDFRRLEASIEGLRTDICGRLDQLVTLLTPTDVVLHVTGPVANPARTRVPPAGPSGVSAGPDGAR